MKDILIILIIVSKNKELQVSYHLVYYLQIFGLARKYFCGLEKKDLWFENTIPKAGGGRRMKNGREPQTELIE